MLRVVAPPAPYTAANTGAQDISLDAEIVTAHEQALPGTMPRIMLGRSLDANVALSHLYVSRTHARISTDGMSYTIEDLASNNSTYINGVRLLPFHEYTMEHGDVISFGSHVHIVTSSPLNIMPFFYRFIAPGREYTPNETRDEAPNGSNGILVQHTDIPAELPARPLMDPSSAREMLLNEFSCSICHELALEPRSLACGHLFCAPCIESWMHDYRKSTCPTCRTPSIAFFSTQSVRNVIEDVIAPTLIDKERALRAARYAEWAAKSNSRKRKRDLPPLSTQAVMAVESNGAAMTHAELALRSALDVVAVLEQRVVQERQMSQTTAGVNELATHREVSAKEALLQSSFLNTTIAYDKHRANEYELDIPQRVNYIKPLCSHCVLPLHDNDLVAVRFDRCSAPADVDDLSWRDTRPPRRRVYHRGTCADTANASLLGCAQLQIFQ